MLFFLNLLQLKNDVSNNGTLGLLDNAYNKNLKLNRRNSYSELETVL